MDSVPARGVRRSSHADAGHGVIDLLAIPWRHRWSERRMARFRDRRYRWLVRHAAATIPFYRRLLESCGVSADEIRGIEDRARLPIVTREALRDAGESAWATDLSPSRRIVGSTSGSSGNPLVLVFDRGERRLRHALNFHCEWLYGWRPWHRGVALGVQLIPPQDTWWQALRLLRWTWVDPARPVSEWVETIERVRPQTIRAYPSALRELCLAAELRGGLLCRPRVLCVGGELYPDGLDALAEATFGIRPVIVYGAVEAGRIGFECAPGRGLHVRVDAVDVEILVDGEPTSPGESGEAVISSLIYKNMPLLRYRLGDIAAWIPGPCPCGLWWPRLRITQGRGAELLVLSDGRRVPITTLTAPVGGIPGITQYQFVHDGKSTLTLRYEARADSGVDPAAALRVLSQRLPGVRVLAQPVDHIPRTATGKVRRFIREPEGAP